MYLFASKVVQVVAKIRVWEDQFPGLKGHRYSWFPSSESLPPDSGIAESTSAPPVRAGPADAITDGPQGRDQRSVRPRARFIREIILVEPNLCSCLGSNL